VTSRTIRRAGVLAGGGILLTAVIAVGWLRARYDAWPWQSVPDQVSVCGRDYLGPGDHVSLDQVHASGAHVIGHVNTFISSYEIWGVENGPKGARCGTGVYVRTGRESFSSYALSGGP
jgi:hypothetical protein